MAASSKAFPGIPEFGQLFGRLTDTFYAASNKNAPSETLPSYLLDLLGDRIIPSFTVHNPDGTQLGKKGRAFHMGLVIEQMHLALRGLMIDFKTSPDFPPEIITMMLNSPPIKEKLLRYQKELRVAAITNDYIQLSPETEYYSPQIAATLYMAFAAIPHVTLTMHTRTKPPEERTVTLPNVMVHIPSTEHSPRDDTPVPLAAVVWALSRARTHLIGDEYALLIKTFIGVQTGITASMKALCDIIQKQLPPGEDVRKFLYVKPDDIQRVITQEAHTLTIFDAFCLGLGVPKIGDEILRLAYNRPPETTLKTNDYCARDTALMLNSTANHLRHIGEKVAASRLQEEFKVTFANESMLRLSEQLLKAADDIAAITPPDWKTVRSYITSNQEILGELQQAWLKVKLISEISEKQYIHDACTPMELVRQLVPQVGQQQELEKLKRSHGAATRAGSPGRS